MKKLFLCIAILFSGISCTKKQNIQEIKAPYFVKEIPSPDRNTLSNEGVELGRMLFYDTALSANGKIACATCHQQSRAFTDGIALTKAGVSGNALLRHAPSLVNLAWQKNGLFWEGGAKDLESLVFGPLTHPDEMAMDLTQAVEIIKNRFDYNERFHKTFGIDTVHVAFIARALAQFQRTLISDNSKYDQFARKEIQLNKRELKGMRIFQRKCESCHQGDLFTDNDFHNNGLNNDFPDDYEGIFQGRFRITLDSSDMGKFKTPSLRNIMRTAPYMHDGRFKSMEEVLAHYSENMKYSSTLDSIFFLKNEQIGIQLNEEEKKSIIAFMHTLTDSSFLINPNYSNPFQ